MKENGEETKKVSRPPVRGSLRLNVSSSTQKVIAGNDFSIFVNIQNPFDTPISVYQTQTHIPVELIDVNGMRIRKQRTQKAGDAPWHVRLRDALTRRFQAWKMHTGVAVAVGTDFEPEVEGEFASISTHVETMGDGASITGIQFVFPENPSTDELDKVFRRVTDYKKGLIPVCLQPGDSVVKQFVLRTRRWLLFTPLTHQFQIQVNYSCDGVDHADTITFQQSIHASIKATVFGGITGAIVGALLKGLTSIGGSTVQMSIAKPVLIAILAAIAVIVAFARKTGVQAVVSVEDFWGGTLIGFVTGFFGFDQFFGIFQNSGGG